MLRTFSSQDRRDGGQGSGFQGCCSLRRRQCGCRAGAVLSKGLTGLLECIVQRLDLQEKKLVMSDQWVRSTWADSPSRPASPAGGRRSANVCRCLSYSQWQCRGRARCEAGGSAAVLAIQLRAGLRATWEPWRSGDEGQDASAGARIWGNTAGQRAESVQIGR